MRVVRTGGHESRATRGPMDLARNLKAALADGRPVVGSWLALCSTSVAEILAAAGFEFLVVDLEHSPASIESAAEIIRVVDLAGRSPLVRVTSLDPNLIKRVLDAGAHGVIVPNVSTAAEAVAAVEATRYAPSGYRGVGLHRAQGYGAKFEEYRASVDDGLLVVVMIESRLALENVESIAAVDGVDAILIGPYDLSSDMGIPGQFEAAEFREAMASVQRAAARVGKACGFHVVEPDPAALQQCFEEGYRFLVYSVDMRILDVGARLGAVALKVSR